MEKTVNKPNMDPAPGFFRGRREGMPDIRVLIAFKPDPDDLMRDIAATGGVVGIGYWADVTCDDSPKGIAAAVAAAIAAVGEDHVSLGSDFDGAIEAALDTSELAAITQAMLDAGLSETQIRKVAGDLGDKSSADEVRAQRVAFLAEAKAQLMSEI